MRDKFNRNISYMRISVTDLCNSRCEYCMPDGGVEKKCHDEILSYEEIIEITKAASKFGISKIRLTGGEPLVRRNIVDLCKGINEIEGIEEICITTNAILLKPMAQELWDAGVRRLNISMDSLNEEKYRKITRNGDLNKALEGLHKAIKLGFKIKLNCVLIGGFNDNEIVDMISLTEDNDIQVRFIELMQIGETANWSKDKFLSNMVVLEKMPELVPLNIDGVAKTYKVPGWAGSVGLISPVSSCFCEDCNRIRLTSDGKMKPCLHSYDEVSLKGLHGRELEDTVEAAIFNKPERHHLDERSSESARNMNRIGG